MVTVQKGNVCRIVTAPRAQEMVRKGYRVVSPPDSTLALSPLCTPPAQEPLPEPVTLVDADDKDKLTDEESGLYLCQLSYHQLKRALASRGIPVEKTDKMADLIRKRDDYIREIKANRKV